MITARLREELAAIDHPRFGRVPDSERLAAYDRIYGAAAAEVRALQQEAGRYAAPIPAVYVGRWDEIRAILTECPTAAQIETMLTDAGFVMDDFHRMYDEERVADGIRYGKDLKDRYSVLWLYNEVER